jgi:LPS-assembly protein
MSVLSRIAVQPFAAITRAAALVLATTSGIVAIQPTIAHAQQVVPSTSNAELLLEADDLIYDNDASLIIARGNVRMDYDGYKVVAQRVSYNRQTRRVKAFGQVEIVEPGGNRIYADEIDLTDDFADGFVNALRVETADDTRFAAESAQRLPGQQTVFNNGVYTACEICKENPSKPPIWRVKAEKVILNGVEKTVEYRNARFEIYGHPIAFLPYFSHADPSVKRKRGFLFPRLGANDDLGFWYRQSYFLPTSDSTDLTFTLGGFSKQGVLGDVRWRHQLENGFYKVRVAGIQQQDPAEFSTRPDNSVDGRAMVATQGIFNINPRWTFGWSLLHQSDNNFSRTYDLKGWEDREITNEIYLKGLAKRSYFELSTMQYLIQSPTIVTASDFYYAADEQAFVRPLLDYNYESAETPLGGLVSFDVNLQSIARDRENIRTTSLGQQRFHGIEGNSTRLTAELEWKRTLNAGGLLITPELALRGDLFNVVEDNTVPVPGLEEGSDGRFIPTAGLTMRYPLMVQSATSSHIFEPVAQIYARTNTGNNNFFVNEDSQSLVFDTTNLLSRNKFSGYDRVEEGVRANIALRYSGELTNRVTLDAMFGQSYHLAGNNAFSDKDGLLNVGLESGLESDVSDFVGSTALTYAGRYKLNLQTRFDNEDFGLERMTLDTSYSGTYVTASLAFTHINAQPESGFAEDRSQLGGSLKLALNENWSIYGGGQFDIEQRYRISNYLGMTYTDECFTYSLNFSQQQTEAGAKDNTIGFRIGFRTLADFGYSTTEDQLGQFQSGNNLLGGS